MQIQQLFLAFYDCFLVFVQDRYGLPLARDRVDLKFMLIPKFSYLINAHCQIALLLSILQLTCANVSTTVALAEKIKEITIHENTLPY